MFKKSLYVATALISLAFIAPAHAQEFDHDTRDNKDHRQFAEKNQSAQHHDYQNRPQERREHHRDNHEGYRSAAHHHRAEYRNDRERYHHDRRHHHNRHEYHAYNNELHLIHHLVVVLASR